MLHLLLPDEWTVTLSTLDGLTRHQEVPATQGVSGAHLQVSGISYGTNVNRLKAHLLDDGSNLPLGVRVIWPCQANRAAAAVRGWVEGWGNDIIHHQAVDPSHNTLM